MTKEFVINEAIRIFGSSRTAYGWLDRARPELDDKKPLDLLETEHGREHILAVLGRIEEGIYS
jgi:putative toxin-antitoxin system antitoxin component (TIGR02293 family)